jgi:molybdopterin-guanine dinucleotide biosynthesis protein A
MSEMMNTARHDITGVILVGGKSRRMGRDKAFLKVAGIPMFERVLEVFRENFSRIILTGDRRERFASYNLPIHEDIYPGSALGGLYTGLVRAETEHVFVCPCDVPFPSGRVIRYLCSLAAGYDAVVPTTAKGFEPLFAVYSRNCLKPMQDQLVSSNFCVYDFYPRVNVRYVREQELEPLDATGYAFINLNTPEEYENFGKESCL